MVPVAIQLLGPENTGDSGAAQMILTGHPELDFMMNVSMHEAVEFIFETIDGPDSKRILLNTLYEVLLQRTHSQTGEAISYLEYDFAPILKVDLPQSAHERNDLLQNAVDAKKPQVDRMLLRAGADVNATSINKCFTVDDEFDMAAEAVANPGKANLFLGMSDSRAQKFLKTQIIRAGGESLRLCTMPEVSSLSINGIEQVVEAGNEAGETSGRP